MNAESVSRTRSAYLIALLVTGFIYLKTVLAFSQETPVAKTPAPDWELTDLNGKMIKFSDFRGKVLMLDFWATWCAPCRIEIPHFVELQKQYRDKGLTVIGVSLDEQGPEVAKKFVKRLGVNYTIVIGNEKVAQATVGSMPFPLPL
jgi:thiol-disulfide isomerase/thioredoxin